jgi:hypothetical protein
MTLVCPHTHLERSGSSSASRRSMPSVKNLMRVPRLDASSKRMLYPTSSPCTSHQLLVNTNGRQHREHRGRSTRTSCVPDSSATRRARLTAATRRGCVTATAVPSATRPLCKAEHTGHTGRVFHSSAVSLSGQSRHRGLGATRAWTRNCGSCVDLPLPVSPTRTSTWLARTSASRLSRHAQIGSNSRSTASARRRACDGRDSDCETVLRAVNTETHCGVPCVLRGRPQSQQSCASAADGPRQTWFYAVERHRQLRACLPGGAGVERHRPDEGKPQSSRAHVDVTARPMSIMCAFPRCARAP